MLSIRLYVGEIGEDLASLADALSAQMESEAGLTVGITAQSGQRLICDLMKTTPMDNVSSAIGTELAALLITALDLLDGSDPPDLRH